ncbi:MAG: hypothetical protein M3Q45_09080 [Chloroflexota bacterium]|nr:hypothetical protein [Chloroflexota bacterium]
MYAVVGAHGGGLLTPSPGHASSCCGCVGDRCDGVIQVVGEADNDHEMNGNCAIECADHVLAHL